MNDMTYYIDKVINRVDLTVEEAADAMDKMLGGGATHAQTASYLTALRMKGETIDEITGSALKMKEKAEHIKPKAEKYVDSVGTGGDGTNTFNISTTAAFVVAGTGVVMAKHGNRAISSRCGSVDLLEQLGIKAELEPADVERSINEIGLGFMYARTFNKSMKDVSIVRGELKTRTIFNILGPVSNPSDAPYQMIGVFAQNLTHPLAGAMLKMGVKGAMVVYSGMDEISNIGTTYVSEIKNGEVIDYTIEPEQFGMKRYTAADIAGGTAEENAKYTMEVLNGVKGAKRDIVVLNAAASVYVTGAASDMQEAIKMCEESIDSGAALAKMEQLRAFE